MALVGILAGAAQVATGEMWPGLLYFTTGTGSAAWASRLLYWWIRFPGTAALTTEGVQRGDDFVEWDDISRVALNRDGSRIDGVRMSLRKSASIRSGERSITIGGNHGTVPDEDLLATVEFFRANPHRRIMLGTPDALRVLALAPRATEDLRP